MNSKLKIGITGGIGSGKSFVCRLFSQLGIPIYYADDRAKELIATDVSLRERIVQLLGSEALTENGLDKAYVAKRVFAEKPLLEQLNAIIHPVVTEDFEKWVENQSAPFVLKEAAILVETGSYKQLDKLILVTAPEEIRIERVLKRDKITREEVLQRMRNQFPDEEKIPVADFVIENDGTKLLLPQVVGIYRELVQLA